MGVTWLTEPISWAFAPGSDYFIVTDVINQIQGLFIFVLFVLKPEVIRRIKKRFDSSHAMRQFDIEINFILLQVPRNFPFIAGQREVHDEWTIGHKNY